MRTPTSVCCIAVALLASCVAHAAVPCVVPVKTSSPLGGCVFLIDNVDSDAACAKFETLIAASTGYSGTEYSYQASLDKACGVLVPQNCSSVPLSTAFYSCNATIAQAIQSVIGVAELEPEGILTPSPNPAPPTSAATATACCTDVDGLYMISTFDNAESMCTAQGALSAAYAAPGAAPKAFYQADYASCTVASVGTCAGYSSQLTTPLPACSPAITASSYAIASLYAADAPAPAPAAEAPVFAPAPTPSAV